MAKKITDQNGDTYVEVKPWYKRWWIWVLAIIVILFIIGALSGGHSSKGKKAGSATTASTPSSITVDYDDYNVRDSKDYNVNYSNSDWDAAKVSINKITVYKLSKPYKLDTANNGKYNINGFIKIHMKIKANSDISIYPQQGTANFNNDQEDAMGESWDGDINKGAVKSGNVYIPVKNLPKATDIKNLRFKFDANGQDNYDDSYTYDITLNLQK